MLLSMTFFIDLYSKRIRDHIVFVSQVYFVLH